MTTTGANELFLDTNVLIYATNTANPFHRVANQTLQDAQSLGIELTVSTQILREYLATATRLNNQGVIFPLTDIIANIQLFQNRFRVVEDTLQVFLSLPGLVQRYTLSGRQVYDANIVATMQTYGITQLLTHNVADFTRFAGLITVVPLVSTTP